MPIQGLRMGSGPLHQAKSTLPPLVGYTGSDNEKDPLPVPAGKEHDELTDMYDDSGCGHAPYEEPGGEAAPAPLRRVGRDRGAVRRR